MRWPRSNAARRSINVYSSLNAAVVAVNDGVIKKLGTSKELGRFIVLQDAYGNRYTYANLGSIAKLHPVPREQSLSARDFKLTSPDKDAALDLEAKILQNGHLVYKQTREFGGR